jgi:tetratricopeptide (TPR) repeat protein
MASASHLTSITALGRLACLFLVATLWLPLQTDADPLAESMFAEANRLYELQRYSEAIESYRALLEQGVRSPALHFNLGNALFRSEQIGQAILHFRLAQYLAPRDPDIRANLQFARQHTNLPEPGSTSLWHRILLHLTLNEWTTLTTVTVWSWLALLALSQLKTRLRPALRPWILALAFTSLLSIIPLTSAWHLQHRPIAVVVVPHTIVRFGPFAESQEHFTAPDGAELHILDQLNAWLQVRDSQGRLGWLTENHVVRLPQPSNLQRN